MIFEVCINLAFLIITNNGSILPLRQNERIKLVLLNNQQH